LGKAKAEKTHKLISERSNGGPIAEAEESARIGKITDALAFCESFLEMSRVSLKKTPEEFDLCAWRAAAELEYALFLFSLKYTDQDVTSGWKTESHNRSDSPAKLLKTVQTSVAKSKESVFSGNWLKAYEHAFTARQLLLRIQREYARKKHAGLLKRSGYYSSSST
jgi:hypothetical protein